MNESLDEMHANLMREPFIRFIGFFGPLLLNIGATQSAAQAAILIYSVDVRAFLVLPILTTLVHKSLFETDPIIYGVTYRYSFTVIAILIGLIITFPKIPKMLLKECKFLNDAFKICLPRRFTRFHFHCWGYLALALDFIMAGNSLDWHYAVAILVLAFNRICDTFDPRGLQDYPTSPLAMQRGFIRVEKVKVKKAKKTYTVQSHS